MKKILLLSLFALAALEGALAQGITISKEYTDYTNGNFFAWFDLSGYPGNNTFTLDGFSVKNTGNVTKTLRMVRREIVVLSGTINYFCWESCYGETVNVSTGNVVLQPDSAFNNMYLDYKPYDQVGETVIRYTIENIADPNDTASILVRFSALPTSIKEVNSVAKLNTLYPNPANTNVTVNYALNQGPASLEIKNLLGQVQRVTSVVAGSKSSNLDVADLPSGIYFVTLKSNGNIIDTKRLVVN